MEAVELDERSRELLADYGRLGTLEAVAQERKRAISTIKNELTGIYRTLGVPSAVAAIWAVFVEPTLAEE
jgi:DNA-binding NarL/FixJ family response regulator